MQRIAIVVAILAAACQTHSADLAGDAAGGPPLDASGTACPVGATASGDPVLENATVRITFLPDASLTVVTKDTGFTWTQAVANPYAVSDLVASCASISATLTRDTESWQLTLALSNTGDGFEATIVPTSGAAHVELPGYPYPFTLPTDQGYYVQNTTSDGLLFSLTETPSIQNMYDFIAIPWWGLTDFRESMMAILETPYIPAEGTAYRSIVTAPEQLKYVFVSHGSYVQLARAYRDYLFAQDPAFAANTLASRTQAGLANLKDGVYVYFWDDAQDVTFMSSLAAAGLTHVVSLIYSGGTRLTAPEINALYTTMKAKGWTAGLYTLPAANLSLVADGDWTRTLTLGTADPVTFYDHNGSGWDHTCMKEKMLQSPTAADSEGSNNAALGLELDYYDTFVVQVAPCLDPSHLDHAPLTSGGPLPSPIDEDRDYRIRFLDVMRGTGMIIGSGEGLAPAWAVPHVDYFEGGMVLGEYGELHTKIPSGGYNDDFATTLSDPTEVGLNTDETHRIPLFELMFHDHVASTWNWRNTNFQYLGTYQKKNLFNALYGTVPMWNMTPALWQAHSQMFLDGYAFTQATRARIGFDDLQDHGFLTADREVQYTDWSNGTRIIANFGSAPYVAGAITVQPLGYAITTRP